MWTTWTVKGCGIGLYMWTKRIGSGNFLTQSSSPHTCHCCHLQGLNQPFACIWENTGGGQHHCRGYNKWITFNSFTLRFLVHILNSKTNSFVIDEGFFPTVRFSSCVCLLVRFGFSFRRPHKLPAGVWIAHRRRLMSIITVENHSHHTIILFFTAKNPYVRKKSTPRVPQNFLFLLLLSGVWRGKKRLNLSKG